MPMKYIVILGISLAMNTVLLTQEINPVSVAMSFKETPVNILNLGLGEDATNSKPIASSKQTSPQKILKKLYAYLPSKVINDMNKFHMEEEKDGSIFYMWYRLSSDEPAYFIHNIQLTATKNDNKLLFYHYKDHSYDQTNLPLKNISKKCAYKMVVNFANEFIPTSDKLNFVNEPRYFSLYNPNHVESWVAEDEKFTYLILINLDYGYVEYYRAEEK